LGGAKAVRQHHKACRTLATYFIHLSNLLRIERI
jgi:hypothetical protein